MITFSNIFVGTLLCALLALLLWFIVRKKYRRVWFPLLAIFTVPKSRLPRLRLRWPPLLAFGCFLLATSAAVLFALRPHSMLPTTENNRTLELYLFIDFSPSLTAYTTIEQYRLFLHDVYSRLRQLGNVTVGTSHDDTMQKFIHPQAFAEHLANLTLHRAGLHMASVLRQQLPRLSDMDRIVIVSDRDQHTWHNLHWRHLAATLHHLAVPQLKDTVDFNLYVQKVSIAHTPHLTKQRLNVEIAAAGKRNKTHNFKITVYRSTQKITQTQASIAANQTRVLLPLHIPRPQQTPNKGQWRLHLQPEHADAVSLDDEFYFNLTSFVPQVTIIADLHGERLLDDPLFQLQTTFEVLGFKIKRRDHASRFVDNSDLVVLAFGRNFTVPQHCPVLSQKTPVWLLPQAASAPQDAICHCYQRLRGQRPTNCRTLAEVLTQDGVAQNNNALYYRQDNITIFTVPPYAQQHKGGLKYASVPVLIQQLLQQQGLGKQQVIQQWPRYADIFSLTPAHASTLKFSNVPRGESLLQTVAQAALPPAAQFSTEGEQIGLLHYHRDAWWWVQGLLALVILAALLEIGASVWQHWRKPHGEAQAS